MMKMPFEINIFFESEKTKTLSDCGIDFSIENSDMRKMSFYVINAISEYREGEKGYGVIHSNGNLFISGLSYLKLKESIRLHNEHH